MNREMLTGVPEAGIIKGNIVLKIENCVSYFLKVKKVFFSMQNLTFLFFLLLVP